MPARVARNCVGQNLIVCLRTDRALRGEFEVQGLQWARGARSGGQAW